MSVCAAFMLLVALLALALRVVLARTNDKVHRTVVYQMLEQSEEAHGLDAPAPPEIPEPESGERNDYVLML